jgi:phosphate transport system substrate-binding protein
MVGGWEGMSLLASMGHWMRSSHTSRRSGSTASRVPAFRGLMLTGLAIAACSTNDAATTSLSGKLALAGSTALQPLATQAAKLFQQQYPHIHVEVSGGGSLAGLSAVSSRQVDIGNSDVYADPAVYPDPDLTDHLVCVIPFVMIVNHDVSVTNLRKQDIIDIFSTGTITNWKQVGGQDLTIVPVVRPATSGTRATFRKYVLAGRDENGTLLKTDSSQTVLDTVANTPGAIGYLAVPVVDEHVGVVAIDGQLPSLESIESGSYAFWGFEHMYTLGDSPTIAAFLNFMLSPEVQNLAQQLRYIPIADMKIAQRFPSGPQALIAASWTRQERREQREAGL